MLAVDVFHVGCAVTLRRLYVLFVIEVSKRSLYQVQEPQGCRICLPLTPLGRRRHRRFGFLIRDRDSKSNCGSTAQLMGCLTGDGVAGVAGGFRIDRRPHRRTHETAPDKLMFTHA